MQIVNSFGKRCTVDDCKRWSLTLSDPPQCPDHLLDLAAWIDRVEQEKDENLATLARESYLVISEEFGSISGTLYHKISGEPPPNVHFRISDILAFCALAAASGVIGNITYDAMKSVVSRLIGRRHEHEIDERITAEFYERVRTEVHGNIPPVTEVPLSVSREVELKHRLIVQKRRR